FESRGSRRKHIHAKCTWDNRVSCFYPLVESHPWLLTGDVECRAITLQSTDLWSSGSQDNYARPELGPVSDDQGSREGKRKLEGFTILNSGGDGAVKGREGQA